MIITIDGPSGTGKSTVARLVAEKLGITHFDTGAMYRSITWKLLKEEIPLEDQKKVDQILESFSFEIREHDGQKFYFVGDVDVTKLIRTQQVTDHVSAVSALPNVRRKLSQLQKEFGEKENAVFEGRDLGTVIFPDAEVKIFLTAKPEVRAQRRLAEMRKKMPSEAKLFDEKKMVKELQRRDAYDSSREVAPLRCPKNALKIDTSKLSIEQVVEKILLVYQKKVKKLLPVWLRAKNMSFLYRLVIFSAWYLFRIFYRHRVYGLEHVVKRSAIIAPNHTSYFDPPITAISWPEEVHFLAKESLFRPFLFGSFIRALNSHPVRGDVADVSVFKTILQLLDEGKQIILFPEGGRTGGELEELKPGIGMLVMRSKSAVVPTYIHGANEIWGRERKFPKLFGKTACVFGKPLLWESYAHLDKKEGQKQITQSLHASISALKVWYEAGAEGIPP